MVKRLLSWSILSIFSAFLTAALASVGAMPLRSFRLASGFGPYWLVNVLVAGILYFLGWPILAIAFFCVFMAVGFFTELDDAGLSTAWAGLGSLGLLGISGSAVFAFWIGLSHGTWWTQLLELVTPLHAQILNIRSDIEISKEALLFQLPGIILLGLMTSLFFSLLGEKVFNERLGVKNRQRNSLVQFRLPDELIWLLMMALLASFYQHGIVWLKYLGVNVLTFCFGAYFFQGLAVSTHFFNQIRLGAMMRVFAYFMLVFQLVLFVSILGVADMWIDFRARRKSKRTDQKMKTENF